MLVKIPFREEVIGNQVNVRVSKNKVTGKVRKCKFPIYNDYGVDDIRSCIDWMVEKKYWSKNKLTIDAHDIGVTGTIAKLIDTIERDNLEDTVRQAVGAAWVDFEESLKLGRKPRYR
jgi:hypothetical protein